MYKVYYDMAKGRPAPLARSQEQTEDDKDLSGLTKKFEGLSVSDKPEPMPAPPNGGVVRVAVLPDEVDQVIAGLKVKLKKK